MNHLSYRLKTIASLVPCGARVCDVGTDHARLPIYLKKNNIAKSVIACDLNEKPLEFARKNIDLSGVEGISLRLSDGLENINENEVDTIIIAGLGGEVISGIIAACEWIKNNAITLIIQPTTSANSLRKFFIENGFSIKKEIPLQENKKQYSIMCVTFGCHKKNYPEYYHFTGEISPNTTEGLLYIKKQQNRILKCMNSLENIPEKHTEYTYYKSAYLGIEKLLTEK